MSTPAEIPGEAAEIASLRDEVVRLQARVEALEAARLAVDELTVERLNVIDRDGTVRLVLANSERSPDPVIDGVPLVTGQARPGLIFFDSRGDECGGLAYGELSEHDGLASKSAVVAFDRHRNDQVVALAYNESNGDYDAGLLVWDRPATSLVDLAARINAIDALPEADRQEALDALASSGAAGAPRVFIGRERDGAAAVVLRDASGKPRLRLAVTAAGDVTTELFGDDGAQSLV